MPNQYASWPLNVCQLGKEATPGTAVPATVIWRSPFGGWDDDRQTETIEEDVGTFGNSGRVVDTMLGAKIPMQSGTAHFEQLLYLLESSVGKVSPTGTGTYTRLYNASIADTPPDLQPYTLRVGNKLIASDVALFSYCLPVEWELSGKQGELWKVSGSWMSPRKQAGAFTSGLALPAWEPMQFGQSKLYIDASGGSFGTTQKTGVLMGFSMKYNPNIEWVPVGDGNLYASAHKIGKPAITFSLELEVQENAGVSVVAQERAFYESKAFRLIRVECPGLSPRKATFDLVAQYTKVGAYNKNGNINTTVTFEGEAKYSPTDAKMWSGEVITTFATIP